jgi:predicted HAD superfamily phosphohydrolase YqeG
MKYSMEREKILNWLKYVATCYRDILEAEISGIKEGNVMLDLDETLVYQTSNQIPGAKEFAEAICKAGLSIYIVTGRIESEKRRQETIADLNGIPYHELHMRPEGEKHSDYKARIKKQISPLFSVADQAVDHPEYLIQNPFYYITEEGEEVFQVPQIKSADTCKVSLEKRRLDFI